MNLSWGLAAAEAACGGAAVWAILTLVRARSRLRAVQARLGPPTSADVLERTPAGAFVTVAGVLEGEPLVSYHPYGASLMDEAHVYAKTEAVGSPALRVGNLCVPLVGPVQVVLGEAETGRRCDAGRAARLLGNAETAAMNDATDGQFRIVRPGTTVLAHGVLSFGAAHETEATYRNAKGALELRPLPDASWPHRPIPLVVAKPRLRTTFTTAALLSVATLSTALMVARGEGLLGSQPAARPSCGLSIDADLATNDIERAAGKLSACDDPLARASVAWAQADFAVAAGAFAAARSAYPNRAPTISEIEAAALVGSEARARELATTLANTLYPGPSTPEKARLECVAGAFGQRTDDRGPFEALMKGPARVTPGCAIVGRDLGYETNVDGYHTMDLPLNEQREFFGRLEDERLGYYSHPADTTYDAAALYADGWMSVHHPYALDVTVVAQARTHPNMHEGYAEDLAARAQAVELLHLASYDIELAIFLAYMGRPLAEVKQHLESVHAVDAFEQEYGALIHEGLFRFAGQLNQDGESEAATHANLRQAVHAGACAAVLLAGGDVPERWLVEGQPHVSSIVRHHAALVHSPEQTAVDIDRYAWPHHDLFEAAKVSTRALAEALARTRVINPSVVRELVVRRTGDDGSLNDWVEHHFPTPCWDCGLTALAANIGARLLDARSVGDDHLARSLELVANRIVEAALKRGVAPELFVLELDPARR